MLVDWKHVIKRKQFQVAGNEVIFFVDSSYNIFVFISFPEEDVVESIYSGSATEERALSHLEVLDITDARDFYYSLKKNVDIWK